MGGRGSSSSGGADLGGGGGGENITVYSTTSLISERGNNQDQVDDALEVLRAVNDRYGYILNDIVVADIGKSTAMAYYEEGTALVGVNKNYFNAANMGRAYDKAVEMRFHPPRGNKSATEAVIAHEMGHALTEQAAQRAGTSFDKMASQIVSRAFRAKDRFDAQEKALRISGYANKNNAECIAEAFADVFCNNTNARKESRQIVNELNRYLARAQ